MKKSEEERIEEAICVLDDQERIPPPQYGPNVIPWVIVSRKAPDTYAVKFWCSGGFALEEEVSQRIAHIITQAIAYGKSLRSKEIREILGCAD